MEGRRKIIWKQSKAHGKKSKAGEVGKVWGYDYTPCQGMKKTKPAVEKEEGEKGREEYV